MENFDGMTHICIFGVYFLWKFSHINKSLLKINCTINEKHQIKQDVKIYLCTNFDARTSCCYKCDLFLPFYSWSISCEFFVNEWKFFRRLVGNELYTPVFLFSTALLDIRFFHMEKKTFEMLTEKFYRKSSTDWRKKNIFNIQKREEKTFIADAMKCIKRIWKCEACSIQIFTSALDANSQRLFLNKRLREFFSSFSIH